jgi:hypothetical protein
VAIMGTDSGDLIFVSLTTGLQVGITFVRATVSVLHICQDNSLDSVFLLVSWYLMHVNLSFVFYNKKTLVFLVFSFHPLCLVVARNHVRYIMCESIYVHCCNDSK